MKKVAVFILLLACREEDHDNNLSPGSGGLASQATEWMVTDLVQGGTVMISSANAADQNIHFQLRKSGVYITDNSVNECNGRFTTDNKVVINFDETINCTKVAGDPPEYGNFKDVLTKEVTGYSVNADTSLLTLSKDAMTYIMFKRLR